MNKIIITVKGGVVENVYSTDKETDVTILDYDWEQIGSITKSEIKEVEEQITELNEVY